MGRGARTRGSECPNVLQMALGTALRPCPPHSAPWGPPVACPAPSCDLWSLCKMLSDLAQRETTETTEEAVVITVQSSPLRMYLGQGIRAATRVSPGGEGREGGSVPSSSEHTRTSGMGGGVGWSSGAFTYSIVSWAQFPQQVGDMRSPFSTPRAHQHRLGPNGAGRLQVQTEQGGSAGPEPSHPQRGAGKTHPRSCGLGTRPDPQRVPGRRSPRVPPAPGCKSSLLRQ